MSLFSDIFTSGYDKAAGATSAGLTAGYNAAAPSYAAALKPFTDLSTSATAGADAYSKALGIGGGDPAAIQKQLEATPGYQFNLNQGLQAIDRGAASRGLTTSGNTLAAEQTYGAGLASKTYNDYLNALQPYLGQQTAAAGGVAGVNTGQGNLAFNTQAGIGNAYAGADVAGQNASNSFLSGVTNLGTKLLGGVNYNPNSGFSYGSQGRTA